MFEWLITVMVFGSVYLSVRMLQKSIQAYKLKQQTAEISSGKLMPQAESIKKRTKRWWLHWLTSIGEKQQAWCTSAWKQKMDKKLVVLSDTGIVQASQWLVIKEFSLLSGLLAGWWISYDLVWAMIIAGAGFFLPDWWLKDRIRTQQQELMQALPNMLDLIAACVQVGLNFEQALELYFNRQRSGLLAQAFKDYIKKISVGQSRQEALKSTAERLNHREFSNFVAALLQSEKLGVPLAETLKQQAAQLRVAFSQRVEKQALEAPVKMLFPLIVFIFPVIFIVLFGPIMLRFLQGF